MTKEIAFCGTIITHEKNPHAIFVFYNDRETQKHNSEILFE